MLKVPSIEADVKMAEGAKPFSAGHVLNLASASSGSRLPVRVLDALSSRKSHQIDPGDDAYVVFLLIDHPAVSYHELKNGASFNIVEGDVVVGTGVVHARVD